MKSENTSAEMMMFQEYGAPGTGIIVAEKPRRREKCPCADPTEVPDGSFLERIYYKQRSLRNSQEKNKARAKSSQIFPFNFVPRTPPSPLTNPSQHPDSFNTPSNAVLSSYPALSNAYPKCSRSQSRHFRW